MAIKTEFSEYIVSDEWKSLLQEVWMQNDTALLNYIDGNNWWSRSNAIITEKLAILLKTLSTKSPFREDYILPIKYTLHEINWTKDLGSKIINLLEKWWYLNWCVDSVIHYLLIHKTEKDIIFDLCTQEALLEKDIIRPLFQVTYKPENDKKDRRLQQSILFTKTIDTIDNQVHYTLYNCLKHDRKNCVLYQTTDLETFNTVRKEKIIDFESEIKETLSNKEWYYNDFHDKIYTKHNHLIHDTFEKIVKNK